MTNWTSNDLKRFEAADELQIAPLKEDGTPQKPVVIWVVRVGDDLFVRSYRGRNGAWFRHAEQRHEGRISSGGVMKDVAFVNVSDDETLNNEVDAAYRSKYRNYGARFVDPMLAPQARTTTLKLVPSK